MQWQIISLLRSLSLVPVLMLHSHTSFPCVKGMLHNRWRLCWTQTLRASLQCAGLLWGSPAYSQSYWNRIVPRQGSRQENLHNRAKIHGSGDKRQKDNEDWHLVVPEHFTPKYPIEPLHQLFRGRPVACPLAEWRDTVTFHLWWEGLKACSSQTYFCHAPEFLGLPYL